MIERSFLVASSVLLLIGAVALSAPSFLAVLPAAAPTESSVPTAPAETSAGRSAAETNKPASPVVVARSFGAEKSPPAAPKAVVQEKVPVVADWLKPVGTITDGDGRDRLFIKDSRRGFVIKIRLDGVVEAASRLVETTPSAYIIELNGERYAVTR